MEREAARLTCVISIKHYLPYTLYPLPPSRAFVCVVPGPRPIHAETPRETLSYRLQKSRVLYIGQYNRPIIVAEVNRAGYFRI